MAEKLEKAVAENDRADFTEELRWAAETVTESLAAVRNAHLKRDQRDLRTRAFYMAWDTARVVFLYNRRYVLTTSWFGNNYSSAETNLEGSANSSTSLRDLRNRQIQNFSMPPKNYGAR